MSTRLKDKQEHFLTILDSLAEESKSGIPIIVEGKNDVHVLYLLEITGDIILAKTSGKSFLDILDEIEKKKCNEVVLLFDFDRRGREWTQRLASCLEGMKIIPNLLFWRMLLGMVGHHVKDIEGLVSYLETLKRRA